MEGQPHIEFDQIEVTYRAGVSGKDVVTALRPLSLSIKKGEFVFLCGQTGCGKSTLIKLITGQVQPTRGTARLNGRDLSTVPENEKHLIRRQMGYIPQDFGLLPRKNVFENVAYAMRAVGRTKRQVRRQVPDILERVHVGQRIDAYPQELSGGEQQRVAIARALINNPPLLLADELTANLDPEHSVGIMNTLTELNQKGATVIMATHDMAMVERFPKRVVRMDFGRIVQDSGNPDFTPPPPEQDEQMPMDDDLPEVIVHEPGQETPDA